MSEKKKVLIAMSGGVDSSVAAALLLKKGYECEGAFMVTNDHAQGACADAQQIAKQLGIILHVLDLRKDFENIIDYFCDEYRRARTPNPCVYCNREIKFGRLWKFALEQGCDFIATGHYIEIEHESDNAAIYETSNSAKDQSYVLAMIDKQVVPHILLPISSREKDQTRQLAAEFGFHIENKPDSQEICFIPDDDHIALLEERCPDLSRRGRIEDIDGNKLADHPGIHRYTIGQRRGLGVAMGKPAYVSKLDAQSNTVTLAEKPAVLKRELFGSGTNWLIDTPSEPFRAKVKVRYNHKGQTCTVYPDGDKVRVCFDEPVFAITPGQTAAIYVEQKGRWRLVGGAWIDSSD
ncbi:tRNA-specific 2-thiouridylase MnmA [Anaerohalosphaera lusitana]|uniref:tRNA-specific 2-thiouridylase MnmA n=1 Tax=Anaerohalosphaera lusitana TaxID=1936003 RepID=A0A1U9NN69_9BACT|nr:tRNA 2-thiouridine(34) synthase MnmA [Anaerohalosphaera lusitana]AQT69060.1 tRNA-specific 2-thiouridylase MnmA [Anaerohalosphaera lusitana]